MRAGKNGRPMANESISVTDQEVGLAEPHVRKGLRLRWETIGVPVAILTLAVIFGALNPTFTQLSNLANISRQIASTGLVAWGQTMVILTAGIDLSVGSVAALVSVVSATVVKSQGTASGILAGIGVGTLAGLVNGFFIGKIRLPPFVVTLAMMSAARGAAMTYTGGLPVFRIAAQFFQVVGQQSMAGVPGFHLRGVIGFLPGLPG